MKSNLLGLLLALSMLASNIVRAEGNCPNGYYPIGGEYNGAPQGCAPIPGNGQAQPQGQVSQQPTETWVDRYGAITADKLGGTVIVGVSNNEASFATAENVAQADCKSRGGLHCKMQTRFRNACGVVIAGDDSFNVGSDTTLDKAVQTGMKMCTNAGEHNCHVYYSGCSLPQRIH